MPEEHLIALILLEKGLEVPKDIKRQGRLPHRFAWNSRWVCVKSDGKTVTNDESQRHRKRDHPSLRDPLPQDDLNQRSICWQRVVAVCLEYSGENSEA